MFSDRNIKFIYLKIYRKIRNFLLSENSRKILIFLFFFLVSSGFWLLQTLKNDFEVELVVPIKLRNVPNDVILTAEPVSELHIVVKDKGTALLNYFLGQSFYPISLNFTDYRNRGNHVVIQSAELESRVQAQLSASTKLISIKPNIEYIYSEGSSKMVPIKFRGRINTGNQYYPTDTVFAPDSVRVYAPGSLLDSIKFAYTQTTLLDGVTDTVHRSIRLMAIKGAKFVPNLVNLTLPVDVLTEKTIEVPLRGVNFPPNKSLRTFPSKVKVSFQVGLSHFKSIRPDAFVFDISYEDLMKNGSEKYKLKLKSTPAGVNYVRIVPDQVDFLIESIPAYGY
ncbi:YbbR-like domain-containing protein [uncultured Bacteroides sp.]|uniref:YbbR-like domain-containing protein n=1 Tax=uncultured Bacteroides sp. TaxID=162156 RepID=UPI002AABF611|nr:YbbR-like domain-containing protein [uncultured Bacteroides sp.]